VPSGPSGGLPALPTSARFPAPDLPDTTTLPESPHPPLHSPFRHELIEPAAGCCDRCGGIFPLRSDQQCLSRRRSRPEGQLGLLRIRGRLLQVRQNPRNHFRLFDAGDHLERAAAARAGVDLNPKDALQTLRPAHGHMARGHGFVGGLITLPLAAHTPMRRCHRSSEFAVRREHPVKSRQMHPGRRHQRDKPRHQIQRCQHDVRGAVTVGGLQLMLLALMRLNAQTGGVLNF